MSRRAFITTLGGALVATTLLPSQGPLRDGLVSTWDLARGQDYGAAVWREEQIGADGVVRGQTRAVVYYSGQVDTITVWNRLLTDDEMRELVRGLA